MSLTATLSAPRRSSTQPYTTRPYTTQHYTVVVPGQLAEPRPTTVIYVRRRLLVSLVLATVLAMAWLGAGNVLANRGGEPASASAVRPATSYVVQPGDTLWSIASAHHGDFSQSTYVDALVQVNGGAVIQIGQIITLP